MKFLKLIIRVIWVTVLVIIAYPLVIISTPIIIIFWSRLSHKIKKTTFSAFKHFESKDPNQTEIGPETIYDTF